MKHHRVVREIRALDIDTATVQSNQQSLTGAALCGVKVVEILYATIGVRGEPADSSGALILPEGPGCPGPYPLLAAGHGTSTRRTDSVVTVGPADAYVSFFAAHGYAVVATDYLGLGKSSYPFHPYLHADSEASAMIDALRAAREIGDIMGVRYSGKVMVMGYSQGGHTAMATQREIERHHLNEFNLVATAPMAGPYALTQTFIDGWAGRAAGTVNALAAPLVAYTVVSYQRIYGDIYRTPDDLFREPYARMAEQMLPGNERIFDLVQKGLYPNGDRLDEMRQPRFTAEFLRDSQHPFRKALQRNDLLDWTPRTPLMLCGASQDSIVEFKNAEIIKKTFASRGVDVPVIDVGGDIPAGMNGHFAASWCYAAIRQRLFDPAR